MPTDNVLWQITIITEKAILLSDITCQSVGAPCNLHVPISVKTKNSYMRFEVYDYEDFESFGTKNSEMQLSLTNKTF